MKYMLIVLISLNVNAMTAEEELNQCIKDRTEASVTWGIDDPAQLMEEIEQGCY